MPKCRSRLRLGISPAACVLAAMMILVLPLRWIAAAMLAALIHELSHFAAVKLCGGNVQSLNIGKRGAVMCADTLSRPETIICVLAGPLGSLSLLLFLRRFPRIAFCGLVQGTYNLLPLYPLDGGRALRCLLSQNVCDIIANVLIGVMFVVAVYLSVFLRLGVFPLLLVFMLWKNRPCNRTRQRVQ